MRFAEVSGLHVEGQSIEHRGGDSPSFAVIKLPGIRKFTNVTLKRGVVQGDGAFRDWLDGVKRKTAKRATVVISLLDETGRPAVTWRLDKAWPKKITGPDLKADANEVAIEELVIESEGLTILKDPP